MTIRRVRGPVCELEYRPRRRRTRGGGWLMGLVLGGLFAVVLGSILFDCVGGP